MIHSIEQMMKLLADSRMEVPPHASEQFEIYQQSLKFWNQKMNLIARGDVGKIVERHFLESIGWLNVFSFPQNATVLDLGTGAGFPGLPMAIMRPDLNVTLMDSNRKKILFLKNLVEELHCPSVRIVLGRAEDSDSTQTPVDLVVSRAVSHTANLIRWTKDILKRPGGTLLTLKGPEVQNEIAELDNLKEGGIIGEWKRREFDPFPGARFFPKNQLIQIFV